MKTFRKTLMVILAATMVLGAVMTVSANPSVTVDVVVPEGSGSGESDGYYVVLPEEESFTELETEEPEIHELIVAYNDGEKTIADVVEVIPVAEQPKLEGKVAVTKVFDVQPVGTAVNNETHEFTIYVSALTEQMTDIVFLHYSEVRNLWEVIPAKSVDYANKQIVIETQDLSPLIMLATVKTGTTNNNDNNNSNNNQSSDNQTQAPATQDTIATSPKTEGTSAWAMWMAVAVALTAAGSVVVYRKRNN